MTTDTIPTLAHAVRIGSDLSLYRERERAELIITHAHGGVLVELVDRAAHERVLQELCRERDELAARLAAIEAQEPTMYVLRSTVGTTHPTTVTRKSLLSCVQSDRVDAGQDHLDPLYTHPAPAAAPDRAEPADDARRYHWLCETFGETALPTLLERVTRDYVADHKPSIDAAIDKMMSTAERHCRCGPDGCADKQHRESTS